MKIQFARKNIFLALALCAVFALASCTNEVDESFSGGTVTGEAYTFPTATKIVKSFTSQVFNGNGVSFASVTTCFLDGYENVPFLRFRDVALIISELNDRGYEAPEGAGQGENGLYYYKYKQADAGSQYPVEWKDDTLCFDATNQTIYGDQFIRLVTAENNMTNGIGQCYFNTESAATPASPKITLDNLSNPTKRVRNPGKTEIKLSDYGIKMFELDATQIGGGQKELFVPFQALSSAFFFFSIATFNGSDYYIQLNSDAYNSNTAFRAYDSGRTGAAARSQFSAEWNYRNLCLFFDLNYSLKSKRDLVGKDNIGPRINDSIFARGLGFGLLSTDTAVYDTALVKFLMGYIDDGHTGYIEPSLYQSKSAVANYKTLARKLSGPRNSQLDVIVDGLSKSRKNAGGGQGVFYVEEGGQKKMAVIAFDGFVGGDPSNLADPVSETDPDKKKEKWAALANANTYQFFRKAFEDIGRYPSVNNVVIDLSCNGGGSCAQCFLALCFLEDPENFYMGQWNLLDDSLTKLTASINDGSSTSLKKNCNFYVLTSGFSFSCGNFFPAVCKWQFNKNNLTVPLVGVQSGGGGANVKEAQTADGALFRTSCATQMCEFDSNGNYVCVDAGVPVDFAIGYDDFYSGSVIYQNLYKKLNGKYSDRF